CRVHSELKSWLIVRPASWLALLSRTFTFELSLAGSPRASVEYNYVGKQSIPTTGLSPASPTALWAAEQGLTPRSLQLECSRFDGLGLDLRCHGFSSPAVSGRSPEPRRGESLGNDRV